MGIIPLADLIAARDFAAATIKFVERLQRMEALPERVAWCEENCQGAWAVDDLEGTISFTQDEDAVYYRLRWEGE